VDHALEGTLERSWQLVVRNERICLRGREIREVHLELDRVGGKKRERRETRWDA